jgi:hypothetical protein
MSLASRPIISAQPGPQTSFLQSPADICIYGGAAGGGKTVGLILEPLRHATRVPNFSAVFFRRTTPQITNPGGLWDESQKFYPRLGGTPHVGMREWRWPRGGKIKFSHLQFDGTVYDWQGAQITLICFDELTHFTARQFFYMVSRNRSTCGVRPYIRATCNPDADSVTFIPARVFDNPALMQINPEYYAWLLSLPTLERERLLYGNWKIRPTAGLYFKREWCAVVDELPAKLDVVRYWDLAATDKDPVQRPRLDGRHQARPRQERRLLAVGHGARAL